jgi:phosphomevalonate kinase
VKLRASAPGKVVLLGEYAVLDGAPALVMAANRRAVADIEPSDVPGVWIHAPDVHAQPVRVEVTPDGALRWHEGGDAADRFTLVTGVLRGLVARGLVSAARLRCRLRLDTAAFFWRDSGDKLGLGSSAALTVALASGLRAFVEDGQAPADRATWLRELLRLHREFQSGRGSGLDVAASLYGGTIRYTLAASDAPVAEPVIWPPALSRLMVWSGHSASTSRFLADLDAWRTREPARSAELMGNLGKITEMGAAAAAAGAAPALLRAVRDFGARLQSLGEAAKIHILTPEHLRIRQLVEAAGGVYKPCGAGGGDLGMAVIPGVTEGRRLSEVLAQAGFGLVDLSEDTDGLRIEVRR